MILKILRLWRSPNCTTSILLGYNPTIFFLEPPWKDNKRNESCIPIGRYPVTYLAKSSSGKYRDVYHIHDVADRGGILIHTGNFPAQTKGCLLPGLSRGPCRVYSSKLGLETLHKVIGRRTFLLEILE